MGFSAKYDCSLRYMQTKSWVLPLISGSCYKNSTNLGARSHRQSYWTEQSLVVSNREAPRLAPFLSFALTFCQRNLSVKMKREEVRSDTNSHGVFPSPPPLHIFFKKMANNWTSFFSLAVLKNLYSCAAILQRKRLKQGQSSRKLESQACH